MKVAIQVKLTVGDQNYEVDLSMPQGKLSANTPFTFGVQQVRSDAQKDPLLQVAIGGEGLFHVAVQPPKSLLELAKIDKVVTDLNVVVSEGKFDGTKFELGDVHGPDNTHALGKDTPAPQIAAPQQPSQAASDKAAKDAAKEAAKKQAAVEAEKKKAEAEAEKARINAEAEAAKSDPTKPRPS